MRTNFCGELSVKSAGKQVKLAGWMRSIRGHGNILFVDLWDKTGIVQLVLDKKELVEKAKGLLAESVIQIEGKVKKRLKPNEKIFTGAIEIEVTKLNVLNKAEPIPFKIEDEVIANEDTRLEYRFLDLRRNKMQQNILSRHKVIKCMRDFFDSKGFIEIETPLLTKSTPEGARDFLVPSRKMPGQFFALPQSPQLFKQILMVAGFDKYFQIAKCFRDEDLRGDRQPEFTQLDLEMSFVEEKDIQAVLEQLIQKIFKEVLNEKIEIPFPRMTHAEAMKQFKSDKPDLRKGKEKFAFLWVTDFPLFKICEIEKKLVSEHHPFTNIKEKDLPLLEKEPLKVSSTAFDLVLNGVELGSGSIRIHDRELQKKIFKILGIGEKEAEERFGFLLNAFKFGAPPHGGFAIGLDRFLMILSGEQSIREVIAFPKNSRGIAMMEKAPSEVDKSQLDELHIQPKR